MMIFAAEARCSSEEDKEDEEDDDFAMGDDDLGGMGEGGTGINRDRLQGQSRNVADNIGRPARGVASLQEAVAIVANADGTISRVAQAPAPAPEPARCAPFHLPCLPSIKPMYG